MGWQESYSAVRDRVATWIEALKADETGPPIDLEYLREGEYRYLTVGIVTEHGEKARCDLCGEYFPVRKVPDLIQHVADHDEQGQAEIDPFATADGVAVNEEATWEV